MTEVKILKMFINGEFEEHVNHEHLKVLNPATEEVIAKIPSGNFKDVDRAINAADAAQKSWEKLPAVERGEYLRKIAKKIREREPEITQTIVNEGGKTFELVATREKLFKVTEKMSIFFYSNVLMVLLQGFYHGTSHSS